MKIDHSEARQGNALIPKGKFEMIVKSAGYKTTKNGTEYIGLDLIIRDDVEQEMQGEELEYPLWRRKSPTRADQACGNFGANQIQAVSKCAGMENGKEYASLEEWMVDLRNRLLLVTVDHETYKERERARATWLEETEHPECSMHFEPDESVFGEDMQPVDDASLPF